MACILCYRTREKIAATSRQVFGRFASTCMSVRTLPLNFLYLPSRVYAEKVKLLHEVQFLVNRAGALIQIS